MTARPRLVDCHCHLNADRFEADADQVLGAARLAGVERILVPGWNVASSERALALRRRASRGSMSRSASTRTTRPRSTTPAGRGSSRWAADPRVVAIGETGLDYDRVFSPIPDQLTNLRRNLALALETGKPAILHCRSADGRRDAQDALVAELRAAGRRRAGAGRPRSGSARRPSSTRSRGRSTTPSEVIDLGLAISFSGLVFRGGEEASAEVAAAVPAIGSWSRPTRRSSRRRARRARATNPSGCASRRRGSPSGAGRPSRRSGADLVAAYDRTFPSRPGGWTSLTRATPHARPRRRVAVRPGRRRAVGPDRPEASPSVSPSAPTPSPSASRVVRRASAGAVASAERDAAADPGAEPRRRRRRRPAP